MTKLQKAIQFCYEQEKKGCKYVNRFYFLGVLIGEKAITKEESEYLMKLFNKE